MADKIEEQLAEGIEQEMGIKAMAAKLAPRPDKVDFSQRTAPHPMTSPYAPLVQGGTVEQKLQQIEQLVREVRAMSAQVKGLLG
jgi:hypothetical protein